MMACPECGHPHPPEFDFCTWPKGWKKGDGSMPVGKPYEACGCRRPQ